MKKVLNIGIIFLLFIQILSLNSIWAGNEDDSEKLTIYLSFAYGKVLKLKVYKKQQIFVLNRFVQKKMIYIFSGIILNEHLSFGQIIKENDIIFAIPHNDNYANRFIGMSNDGVSADKIRAQFSSSDIKMENTRLSDIFLMKKECKPKSYRRFLRRKISDLAKDCDMNASENKFPTIVPQKLDSVSVDPLPPFWTTN